MEWLGFGERERGKFLLPPGTHQKERFSDEPVEKSPSREKRRSEAERRIFAQ
jgi:hypothetical protein